jgi:single-strand DNA-binding protein
MSSSIDTNNCTISGHLTSDPKIIDVGKNKKATFSIAIHHYGDNTSYLDIESWDHVEPISKYFKKGKFIVLIGEIRQDRYEKEGQKRSHTYLKLKDFNFVSNGAPKPAAETATSAEASAPEAEEDEISL